MRIWQRHGTTETWICAAILEETHHRSIRCSSWSPDGRYLATASFDATTAIWEIQVGNCSVSARRTASMHRDKHIIFVQGSTWEQVALLEGHESEVKGVAWSSSGTDSLSAAAATLCTDASLCGHGHTTEAFCMTDDAVQAHGCDYLASEPIFRVCTGSLLATCSRDKSVWIWESLPGNEYECVDVKQGHTQVCPM